MRTLKLNLYTLLILLTTGMQAQMEKPQAFWVHEDHVKPAMADEYEAVGKQLIENLKKHHIQDEQWITAQTADFRYLYVGPLNNMGDLDRELFSTLSEKMGQDNLAKLLSEMDGYYTKHFNYVIYLDPELSYMPAGINQMPEGKNFRKFYYLHTTPAMNDQLAEAMKGIKELYESSGSEMEYRVYRSGFGAPNDFFMVAIADKDPLTYEQNSLANQARLGDAAKPVFDKAMEYVTKFEVIPGNMRPDLGYSPE